MTMFSILIRNQFVIQQQLEPSTHRCSAKVMLPISLLSFLRINVSLWDISWIVRGLDKTSVKCLLQDIAKAFGIRITRFRHIHVSTLTATNSRINCYKFTIYLDFVVKTFQYFYRECSFPLHLLRCWTSWWNWLSTTHVASPTCCNHIRPFCEDVCC